MRAKIANIKKFLHKYKIFQYEKGIDVKEFEIYAIIEIKNMKYYFTSYNNSLNFFNSNEMIIVDDYIPNDWILVNYEKNRVIRNGLDESIKIKSYFGPELFLDGTFLLDAINNDSSAIKIFNNYLNPKYEFSFETNDLKILFKIAKIVEDNTYSWFINSSEAYKNDGDSLLLESAYSNIAFYKIVKRDDYYIINLDVNLCDSNNKKILNLKICNGQKYTLTIYNEKMLKYLNEFLDYIKVKGDVHNNLMERSKNIDI